MTNLSLAERLRLMASEADQEVASARDSADGFVAMQAMGQDRLAQLIAKGSQQPKGRSAQLLEELNRARDVALNSATGFNEYGKRRLGELAAQDVPEPEEVLALLKDLTVEQLPNGQHADPVFRLERDFGRARKEFAGGSIPLVLPHFDLVYVVKDKDGKEIQVDPDCDFVVVDDEKGNKVKVDASKKIERIMGRGPRAVVPTRASYRPLILKLAELLDKAAAVLIGRLEGEYLANADFLRDVGKSACTLLRAPFVSRSTLRSDYQLITGETSVYARVGKDKRPRGRYVKVDVSGGMSLMVDDHELGRKFANEVERLRSTSEKFFEGKLDIERTVVSLCNAGISDGVRLLSKAEWGIGEAGMLLIEHTGWKLPKVDEPVRMVVLFQRGQDSSWRWVFANPEAVRGLFRGWGMAYHGWTADRTPRWLEAFISGGTDVLAADLEYFIEEADKRGDTVLVEEEPEESEAVADEADAELAALEAQVAEEPSAEAEAAEVAPPVSESVEDEGKRGRKKRKHRQ